MQPGQLGSQVPSDDAIVRRIADLERTVRELAAQNNLATAGITVQPNGITVTGSETVTGDLIVSGTETISGDLTVTGTLSLPNGSVNNAALVAPVVISTSGVSQNNINIGTTATVYASAAVTVPDGYSQADILCMVVAGAYNGTTAGDYLYIASSINGTPGGETPASADASKYQSGAANGIRTLTGLSGGTINLGCQVRAGSAWGANSSNFANMNAVIFFRR